MEEKEKKTLKVRLKEANEWAKQKAYATTEWCKNNREMLVVFGPVLLGSLIEVIKIGTKRSSVNDEKALKERYIYDRSAGHYYDLRRKPRNSEWKQIDQRRNNGEPLGEILDDMRLLK